MALGLSPGTGVPAARNFATENQNRAMETTTRGTPIGAASDRGRNGRGAAGWSSPPTINDIRYTSGGRISPRLATSSAWFGGLASMFTILGVHLRSLNSHRTTLDVCHRDS